MFLGIDSSLRRPGAVLLSDQGLLLRASHLRVGDAFRGGERLSLIYRWLADDVLRDVKPGDVAGAAIEGPSLESTHREYDLGSAFGVCQLAAFQAGYVECRVIEPSRLKKFATGNGAASKEEVLYAVKDLWAVSLTDDNEGDAYVLAQIARSLVHNTFKRRSQAEIVHEIRYPLVRKRTKTTKSPDNI